MLEAIRERELEAGLVTLPIDTTGLVVQPTMTDENLYAAVEGPDVELPVAIEVEHLKSALGLASKGFGGTYVLQTLTREASFPENLPHASWCGWPSSK